MWTELGSPTFTAACEVDSTGTECENPGQECGTVFMERRCMQMGVNDCYNGPGDSCEYQKQKVTMECTNVASYTKPCKCTSAYHPT